MKKIFSSFVGSFFGGALVLGAVFIPAACADPAQQETPLSETSIMMPQMVPETSTQMTYAFASMFPVPSAAS